VPFYTSLTAVDGGVVVSGNAGDALAVKNVGFLRNIEKIGGSGLSLTSDVLISADFGVVEVAGLVVSGCGAVT